MNIDSIENGIVIDHIAPGKGMEIVTLLNLEKLTCPIAVIRNARSSKSGRKDIVKIEGTAPDNLDVLGFIDPNITVNIISSGHIVSKKRLNPPDEIINVIKCKNPRCITSTEKNVPHIFRRQENSINSSSQEKYRCAYCEQEY